MESPSANKLAKPVIFFDGVCLLCNGFVDGIIKRDKNKLYRFAALQGETAQIMLGPNHEDSARWSVVMVDEFGQISRESTAVLNIINRLGTWYSGWRIFFLLPTGFRDAIYRWVARNRYRWFGKKDACRLPSNEEKERFLP